MKKMLFMLAMAVTMILPAGVFEFDGNNNIMLHGKKFITNEKVTVLNKEYDFSDPQFKINNIELPAGKVQNCITEKTPWPARRELFSSGSELELTFQGQIGGFQISEDEAAKYSGYAAELDVSDFDGGSYIAITGRSFKPVTAKGDFKLDGSFNISGLRFLALEKDGRKLAMDFNKEGVTNYSSGAWAALTRDNKLVLKIGTILDYRGGVIQNKVLFYEGGAAENTQRHARQKYGYSNDFTVDRAYSFAAGTTGKNYVKANNKIYDEKSGFGWLAAPEAKACQIAPSGALYSVLQGSGKAVFKVSNLKSGVYFVTLRASAPIGKSHGAFSARLQDQELVKDCVVPAGEILTATLPLWIESGSANLTLEGQWQISTLQFQLLQTSYEDIKFRRGFWISDDYEPSLMKKNAYYSKPVNMTGDVYTEKLPPHRSVYPADYKFDMPRRTLLPESTEQNAWRYNELYLSSGANKSNFTEFPTDELKSRELDIIGAAGGKIVLVSGLLSRHTFPDHLPRVKDYLTRFTHLAHQRGMKVFDHVDLTLLWNSDVGFRVMCQTTPALERDVRTGAVNRIYCINNPVLNNAFFSWAKDLVKASDIDGMMVDEVTFFTENFCGCRYCREKFTRDTGLTISMDETDPSLGKSTDPVWKIWLLWRYKCVGDWWVEFREAISTVKKDFSMLVYTTHGGFSNRHAAPLFEAARGVDILGTEIMSRNVIAAARPVNAFRKMKSGLGDYYHAPVYGLVYPGGNCYNIAYFGWALNYMNRQTTWDKNLKRPEGASDYRNYPERLDHRCSYPVSDTAILYSLPSMIFPASMRYVNEILGVSEVLTDMGIMHDFIVNDALTDGKTLKRLKSLLIANARCLSDKEIAAVKEFARNGGTVYISFHGGTADELGNDRLEWPFKEVFDIAPVMNKFPSTGVQISKTGLFTQAGNDRPAVSPTPLARLRGTLKADTVEHFSAKIGPNTLPCVVSAPYGKGQIIYSSAAWGALVMETESGPNKVYNWNPPAQEMELVKSVLQLVKPEKTLVEFTSLPERVIASLTGNRTAQKDLTVVNLINYTNGPVVGKVTPATMKSDRGLVKGDIVFSCRIPAEKIAGVYAVSPDFAGRKPLEWQANGSDAVTVKVPGVMLKTFMEVRLQKK